MNDSYDDDATIGKERDPEIFSGVIYLIKQIADKKGINNLTINPRSGKGDKKIVKDIPIDDKKEMLIDEIHKVKNDLKYATYPTEPTPAIEKIFNARGKKWNGFDVYIKPMLTDLDIILNKLDSEASPKDGKAFVSTSYTAKLNDKVEGASTDILSKLLKEYGEALISNTDEGLEVTENRREKIYDKLLTRYMPEWNISKSYDNFVLTR